MKKTFLIAVITATTALLISCGTEDYTPNQAITENNGGIVDPTSSGVIEPTSSNSLIPVSSAEIEVPVSSAIVFPVSSATTPKDPQIFSSSTIIPESSSALEPPVSSSSQQVAESSSSIIPFSSSEILSSSSVIPEQQPSRKSVGCGKTLNIQTGFYKISSNGKQREYAIDVPANYDPNKPYRLIYCSHWIWSSAKDIVNGTVSPNGGAANWAFYGLKRVLDSAGVQAVFIAPTADGGMWGEADHALFDNLLKHAEDNLCIDTGLVFATGFSFGAMQTFSLSTNHQKKLRAVATIAAANYNIWLPANTHEKIPYLGLIGMSDTRCPYVENEGGKRGGYFAALTHAQDNGCDIPSGPNAIDKTYPGSKTHTVYDFKNCPIDYPVRIITFDGGHIAAPTDGQNSDDGRRTWAPHETWKFFSQFK